MYEYLLLRFAFYQILFFNSKQKQSIIYNANIVISFEVLAQLRYQNYIVQIEKSKYIIVQITNVRRVSKCLVLQVVKDVTSMFNSCNLCKEISTKKCVSFFFFFCIDNCVLFRLKEFLQQDVCKFQVVDNRYLLISLNLRIANPSSYLL